MVYGGTRQQRVAATQSIGQRFRTRGCTALFASPHLPRRRRHQPRVEPSTPARMALIPPSQ